MRRAPSTAELRRRVQSNGHAGGSRVERPPPSPGPAAPAVVRQVSPYEPFPVDSLPGPVALFVREGALAIGCDAAYLAMPALAVLASAIGNTRTIRLKRGWEEPAVVWSAAVGESGTLKSPAYAKAVAPLFRRQGERLQEHQRARAKYEEDLAAHKEAKRKAREADGACPRDLPEEPVLQRVVCSDVTIEKLAEIIDDNPRGVLVARDELSGWIQSFARYKSAGGSDLPNWLEMHRAGQLVVDRKTGDRKTLFVRRAAASVTGGIQPAVLAKVMTAEFLSAGLLARILLAMPPRLSKRWSEREVTPEVEQGYADLVDGLLGLAFGQNGSGEYVPYVLHFSAEAKTVWVGFFDRWAEEQAAAEGELAAAFSKLEGYAARFTLLHHVAERVSRGEDDRADIGPESAEAGIALCRWFAEEARRIYATISESVDDREARQLVDFIRSRGGEMGVRDLQRANSRKYPSADEAQRALDALAAVGLGDWHEQPRGSSGGWRARVLRLRPTHDTSDTRPGGR